ncbi:unnamed protein product, partial [marine sediment metagenome]
MTESKRVKIIKMRRNTVNFLAAIMAVLIVGLGIFFIQGNFVYSLLCAIGLVIVLAYAIH